VSWRNIAIALKFPPIGNLSTYALDSDSQFGNARKRQVLAIGNLPDCFKHYFPVYSPSL
jgi:hypothetical protein